MLLRIDFKRTGNELSDWHNALEFLGDTNVFDLLVEERAAIVEVEIGAPLNNLLDRLDSSELVTGYETA